MRIGMWIATVFSVACFAAPDGATSPLADAAKNRDKETVRSLLKQHADVNAAEPDGTTPLHWAAHWNDLEMADLLLKAGANVKAVNRYSVTPLSEAAANGSGALVERLIKAGADPNGLATAQGQTVLMTASRVGNVEAVKVLLEHGASVHASDEFRGQTALMWAAAEGHPEVLKLLIAKGPDLNARSFDRDTTMPKNMTAGTPIAAIARGGFTALLFAARQGQVEAARVLLDAGADINEPDSDRNNALIISILNTHYDVAKLLIERGADPNLANKDGRAALYTAVDQHDVDWSPRPARKEVDQTTSLDVIRLLLEHGANANGQLRAASPIAKLAQDGGDRTLSAGATPFMRAARSADVRVMKLLLDHFAEPTLANKDGLSALLVASGVGYSEQVKGTEPEALEAVKMCVGLGLDVNTSTDRGDTALHGAAMRGADSIVKYLVEQGAKLDAKNKAGLTPLDIAMGKRPASPIGGGSLAPAHESTVALIKQLMESNPVAKNADQ